MEDTTDVVGPRRSYPTVSGKRAYRYISRTQKEFSRGKRVARLLTEESCLAAISKCQTLHCTCETGNELSVKVSFTCSR